MLSLFSWCLVIVVWPFLAMPWVCLQFVIEVFPDHTRLLFLHAILRVTDSNIIVLKLHFLTILSCRFGNGHYTGTVLPDKSDSGVMFCLQSYQDL